MPTALVTGATQGLGAALADALAHRGWDLVVTARDPVRLDTTVARLGDRGHRVVGVPGDVADAQHRKELVAVTQATCGRGGLHLLVNNASTLGPVPLRPVVELATEELAHVFAVNVLAPHALLRELLPSLAAAGGAVVDVSSDAAVEHYEAWGGYGASKAALDHLTLTLAAEAPGIRAWSVDPGDMRTAMHQAAFPGEDVSDRPLPSDVAVPALLALLDTRPPSGRYRAAEIVDALWSDGAGVAP
jgi:NAD(P)-dependent dehydrogenase (short-subunit alcohol dehydrogenase family)